MCATEREKERERECAFTALSSLFVHCISREAGSNKINIAWIFCVFCVTYQIYMLIPLSSVYSRTFRPTASFDWLADDGC